MYRPILLISLLYLALACSSPAAEDIDVDGDWQLVAGSVNGEAIPLIEDSPVRLNITGTQIGGTSGCNSYGGQLVLDGSGISIGDLTSTLMMCTPDVMAVEIPYTAALPEVDTVALDGDGLVLTGPGIELRFTPTE